MKRITFIAAPNAGKGTVSSVLTKKYNLPHISVSALLKETLSGDTAEAKEIKDIMASGKLVSDEIVFKLIKDRLSKDDCASGYILDGFPRNIAQAEYFENLSKEIDRELEYAFILDIDMEVAMKRALGRIVCPKCGTIYNIYSDEFRPKEENICDKCHEEMTRRADDTEETFKTRFNVYLNETAPLISFYEEKGLAHHIDANEGSDKVLEIIESIIND